MVRVLSVLCLALIACVIAQDVQIQTTHTPEECIVKAKKGDTVKVHYTGRLTDGRIFDSSIEAKRDPIEFELGAGRVIPGWERGIAGMCVGEKRILSIPPELGYGNQEVGPIPAGSTLIFETELVEISQFGPGLHENVEVGSFSLPVTKSSLGFLAIVVGFFGVVGYLIKAKPELDKLEKRAKSPKSKRR